MRLHNSVQLLDQNCLNLIGVLEATLGNGIALELVDSVDESIGWLISPLSPGADLDWHVNAVGRQRGDTPLAT
jgi:hypothetical protein